MIDSFSAPVTRSRPPVDRWSTTVAPVNPRLLDEEDDTIERGPGRMTRSLRKIDGEAGPVSRTLTRDRSFFHALTLPFVREGRRFRPMDSHKAKSRTESTAAPRPDWSIENHVRSGRDSRGGSTGMQGRRGDCRRPGTLHSSGSGLIVWSAPGRLGHVGRSITEIPGGPDDKQIRDRLCDSEPGEERCLHLLPPLG